MTPEQITEAGRALHRLEVAKNVRKRGYDPERFTFSLGLTINNTCAGGAMSYSRDQYVAILDRLYAQFAQNALQYQSIITFLGNRIKTLLTAIRGD